MEFAMIRKTLHILVVIVACSFAFSCHGQITAPVADQAPPVFDAGHNFLQTHSLNETINPVTGAVSLKITVPVPNDRGEMANFAIQYDSNSEHHGQYWFGNMGYLTAGGWSYVLPSLSVTQGSGTPDQVQGGGGATCVSLSNYMMTDLNGTMHALNLNALGNANSCNYGYGMSNVLSGGDANVGADTTAPDNASFQPVYVGDHYGTSYTFAGPLHQTPGDNGFSTNEWMNMPMPFTSVAGTIEDRNGNLININDQGGGKISITDTGLCSLPYRAREHGHVHGAIAVFGDCQSERQPAGDLGDRPSQWAEISLPV